MLEKVKKKKRKSDSHLFRWQEKGGRRERKIRRKYYEKNLKYLLSYFPHKFWKSTLVNFFEQIFHRLPSKEKITN